MDAGASAIAIQGVREWGVKLGFTEAAEMNPPPLEKTDRPLSSLLWLKLWGLL